jgi:hypothetical protein
MEVVMLYIVFSTCSDYETDGMNHEFSSPKSFLQSFQILGLFRDHNKAVDFAEEVGGLVEEVKSDI